MSKHPVVSREQWLERRKALLAREKELSKLRDQISQERRELPWVKVDKPYEFIEGSSKLSLRDLFGDKSQLIIYHFMFAPDWTEGCPSCSFWADNANGTDVHLAHRDVAYALVSLAPYKTLASYKERMGWSLRWVSSQGSDFNFDYGVSFTPEQVEKGAEYNYRQDAVRDELPGVSVFVRDGDDVFHTYSTYARGLDMLNGAYHYLDLVPKGRDEKELPWSMAWLRRRDQYED